MQPELVPLLQQSVYSRLAGYEDTNDAARLGGDPAMRAVVSRRALEKHAASTNAVSRFETEVLAIEENLEGPEQLNEEFEKWSASGIWKSIPLIIFPGMAVSTAFTKNISTASNRLNGSRGFSRRYTCGRMSFTSLLVYYSQLMNSSGLEICLH